ncbi:MAG TPA: FAD:protein FMN transferase, partial [Spirochaetota bacterium]|nr:FAD:protein FMN transferase [Spirochaetota bacterium]
YASDSKTDRIHTLIKEKLQEINKKMSLFDPNSEISRFNKLTTTNWFAISRKTALVIKTALTVCRQTKGKYDITIAPLVELWGFGPENTGQQIPQPAAIKSNLARCGYQKLRLRLKEPAVRKTVPGLALDLASIAKGYGVDKTASLLQEQGLSNFLIDIGGEVKAGGSKKGGIPWKIGISKALRFGADQDDLSPAADRLQCIIELTNKAVATSGDYQNFFKKNGQAYTHIIDPRTGTPVKHRLAAVSVMSRSCMTADCWATALLSLGPKAGPAMADRAQLSAFFIIRSNKTFIPRYSGNFTNFLSQPPKQ